ncbi:hypothetical protein [Streptomyces mangrovisoli]|uniref:Extensin n=1 Tax=Streptomyces mangrovisoli TaxID=1428628 RepID=A0A1J4NRI4_9ACTN|nr:hypothetical protein [Streptomyces mangrovisoli]OIJ64204.1 hypothetical protein WN71_030080 [Streptomyces mangrovisoli]
MADEQYRWLDRATAERLLRGEPLDPVDVTFRDQAERLAGALGALAVPDAEEGAELPGEASALAAFRKVREARAGDPLAAGHGVTGPRNRVADAGLVRLGVPGGRGVRRRSRWGRPVRFALGAALAFGTVGGVAVAAGTGVLPTPFVDQKPGRPASSVSAADRPGRPSASPSEDAVTGPGSGLPLSGGVTGAPSAGASPAPTGTDTPGSTPSGGPEPSGRASAGNWPGTTAACRAVRDGKRLDADRKRTLTSLAGGSGRVWRFCRGVLEAAGESVQSGGHDDGQGGDGQDGGGQDDQGGSGDDDGHLAPGGHHGSGVVATPEATAVAPATREAVPTTPVPEPDTSYTPL